MKKVLKDYEIPQVVNEVAWDAGKTLFELAEDAGLSNNTAYNWSKNLSTPRLPQFLWFLDAAGYRLVLEKKEGAE